VDDRISSIGDLVAAHAGEAVALRRALHAEPELGWQERATTAAVADVLRSHGLEPMVRDDGIGLVVDVGDGTPAVAFRADLDALPIQEDPDRPGASRIPGVMHACGHDAHTATAAGIAIVLHHLGDAPGRVRFVFQPAEELIRGGGSAMAAEGALAGASSIIAFHVDPAIPAGTIGLRTGSVTGASDRLRIKLTGPGGHTSRPHQTVDLIHVAARVVIDLPNHLRRITDPRSPIAIVFGNLHGGTAENVIPAAVELGGTVRLFDLDLWRALPTEIDRMVHDIVAPYGATAQVEYEQGAPPVVNDACVVATVRRAAERVLGREAVLGTEQSLGSEDFSWFLEQVPGALVRLGAGLPDRRVDLHSADFDIDEDAIPTGMLVGTVSLLGLLDAAGRR
jgi:amidohydrolase